MKQLFLLISIFIFTAFSIKAQGIESSKPFIEVTGTSEMEVIPDEIYITITLLERMDGKEKITIDKQEADLKKNLKELGIDLSNLSLNSANADYGKVRRSEKDVLVSKSYSLKIGGTDMLAKVFERLDKINASDAYISKYTHSKIQDLQKENRIKAVEAGKAKVDYLLAALSQKAGVTLEIRELDNYIEQAPIMPRRMMAQSAQMVSNSRVAEESDGEMAFKKIKLKSSFLIKYEILAK